MQLTRLRLSGFKSFSDPAELAVEFGLTGVVGPNGCGKSNIVEALRWAMGESSARGLRGEEMDDVIFGGSGGRPAFDVAEVRLRLLGPVEGVAGLRDSPDVEVSRRISRGQGSVYRINGREVRARDVQLLFADAGAGTRSAAIIGQGQVGFIVESKPQERRKLLEEAAGIGGLHARRRDAEARLAAAEANLQRVLDLLAEQQGRLAELERQDRQAERYRKVAGELRAAEALWLLARFREAEAALAAARAAETAARSSAGEAGARAAALRRDRDREAAALPALRDEVSRTSSLLAALAERRAQRAAAAEQRRTHRAALERQLAERTSDRTAAAAEAEALAEALGRIEAEAAGLSAEAGALATALPAASADEATAAAGLAAAEAEHRNALAEAARAEAALDHARVGFDRARERLAGLDAALAGLGEAQEAASEPADTVIAAGLAAQEAARRTLEAAEAGLARCEAEAADARAEAEAATFAAAAAREALAAAEAGAREAEAGLARLSESRLALERAAARLAERERAHEGRVAANRSAASAVDLPAFEAALATAEVLLRGMDARLDAARVGAEAAEAERGEMGAAVREAQRALDALDAELRLLGTLAAEVPAGALLGRVRADDEAHARALAAALADDLLASDDPEAPLRWRDLGPLDDPPPLPGEAVPLAAQIEAPEPLARRLGQVGLVPAERGAELQPRLRPGQRLVSREGGLWRWDGFVRGPEAEDAGSARVRHRLRLDAAREERRDLEAALAAAREAEREKERALAELRRELAGVEAAWRQADAAQTAAGQRLAAGRERWRDLAAEAERLAGEGATLRREREELEQEFAASLDPAAAESEARARRADRDRRRGELDGLERARSEAASRATAAERASVEARAAAVRARAALEAAREALERRRAEAEVAAIAKAAAAAERRARAEGLAAERQQAAVGLALAAGEHETAAATAETARAAADAAMRGADQARRARQDAAAKTARLREMERRLGSRSAELAATRTATDGRLTDARRRAAEAADRADRLAGELEALGPAEAGDGRDPVLDGEIVRLEARQAACAGGLKEAEDRLAAVEAAFARVEADAAAGREGLALAGAERGRAEAALDAAAALVVERLQRPAHALLADAATADAVAAADPGELEARLAKLRAARERIGPVNLRAGSEAEEARAALARTRAEEEELRAAIGRLKQATARLSREGRDRLQEVFGVVDGHFRELFARLFGGGRAQLRLIEADDPLEAGLELEASPPGKRLASIGLLSGGEKTLTALALVFAFFLAKPAPLCVLDEADAPLDDANVDRFVSLMRDIAAGTGTRFLVVTHHPLTMARMDRLYGVTMSERGVSRLVSVALEEAVALRATA